MRGWALAGTLACVTLINGAGAQRADAQSSGAAGQRSDSVSVARDSVKAAPPLAASPTLIATPVVGSVTITGNKHIGRSSLLFLMRLAPTRKFFFWTRHPIFYEDFLRNDLAGIAGYYRASGYLHVGVTATRTDRGSTHASQS